MFRAVQEYAIFKKELIDVERCLLRTLGFIMHVDHPHKFVLDYSRILDANPRLRQEAWNLANDRYPQRLYPHPSPY